MAIEEQEREISRYMKGYIKKLEECGYVPRPVPDTFGRQAERRKEYIIMEASQNGVPISTKVIYLLEEAQLPLTRANFENDIKKQQKYLGKKIAQLPEDERRALQDNIEVMNKMCGLSLDSAATKKRSAPSKSNSSTATARGFGEK